MAFTRGVFTQKLYNPVQLGLSAVTLAAERTSNTISLAGVQNLAVYVNHTNNSATKVIVDLDVTPEGFNGDTVSNWYVAQTTAISSGTVTLSDLDGQKTVNASKKFEIRFTDLNACYGRIRISSTGGGASDLATVTVVTGQMS